MNDAAARCKIAKDNLTDVPEDSRTNVSLNYQTLTKDALSETRGRASFAGQPLKIRYGSANVDVQALTLTCHQ